MTVSRVSRSRRTDDLLARLDAAAGGDQRAIHALVAECRPAVVRFAAARGSLEPEAIADTVMLELLGRLDRLCFETANHLWAYLYRITRSRIADERRRRQPDQPVGDGGGSGTDEPGVHFEHDVVERLWLRGMLADLTEDQRQVLELRFLDDLSIEETASRTGRTLTAVKALQRRAIRAVAAGLVAALAFAVYLVGSGDERPVSVSSSGGVSTTVPGPADGGTGDDIDATDDSAVPPTLSGTPHSGAASRPGVAPVVVGISVDAGPDQTIQAPATVTLAATAARDRDNGTSEPVEGRWLQVSGPADVVLTATGPGGATGPVTTPGQYVFRYQVADGELSGADEVAVTVTPPEPTYSCLGQSGTASALTASGFQVVVGTEGDDVIDLSGDPRPAVVLGQGGNDAITTGAGADWICGGNGNDTIRTGAGDDRVSGDNGNDGVWSGDGADRVNGGAGTDRLNGEAGNDVLRGGNDNDVLNGAAGDDQLFGGSGDDLLQGGPGADKLFGEVGFDTLQGGDGSGDQCDLGTSVATPAAATTTTRPATTTSTTAKPTTTAKPAASATTRAGSTTVTTAKPTTTTARPATTATTGPTTTVVESADGACESVVAVGDSIEATTATTTP